MRNAHVVWMESVGNGGGRPRLCDFLVDERDEILAAWERSLRSAEGGGEAPLLGDEAPALLERLAEAVRAADEGEPSAPADLPYLHPLERFDALDPRPATRELSYLRTTALELWRGRGPGGPGGRGPEGERALHRALDEVIARSVVRSAEARARAAVRERQRALDALEHGDPFMLIDGGWRILAVNTSQELATRRPREDTLGRVFWDVWPEMRDPASAYFRELSRCMRERVPVRFEEYFRPREMWTEVTAYPAGEAGIAVFLRDVSERKRTEERARAAEAELLERAKLEQQLIGIVSHDLRNPLNAIAMATEALLRRRGNLDGRALALVTRIQSAVARASALIRDLLDFTRARRQGGIPIVPEPLDLHGAVRAAAEEVHASWPDRELRIEHHGEGTGTWDRARIEQVVQNLVSNAFKYGAPDAPVVLRTECGDRWVRIAVKSEGEPIDPALLPHIFEPLRQARRVGGVGGVRGVGLGLYIVDHIARAHGGSVDVASTAKEGTTFTVTLPREPPSPDPEAPRDGVRE